MLHLNFFCTLLWVFFFLLIAIDFIYICIGYGVAVSFVAIWLYDDARMKTDKLIFYVYMHTYIHVYMYLSVPYRTLSQHVRTDVQMNVYFHFLSSWLVLFTELLQKYCKLLMN